ncbi:MAG: hypothetical protein ACYDAO_08800 [Thermoplasmataceae archaeon]
MPTDDFEAIYTNPCTRKLLDDLKKKEQAKAISEENIELPIALECMDVDNCRVSYLNPA